MDENQEHESICNDNESDTVLWNDDSSDEQESKGEKRKREDSSKPLRKRKGAPVKLSLQAHCFILRNIVLCQGEAQFRTLCDKHWEFLGEKNSALRKRSQNRYYYLLNKKETDPSLFASLCKKYLVPPPAAEPVNFLSKRDQRSDIVDLDPTPSPIMSGRRGSNRCKYFYCEFEKLLEYCDHLTLLRSSITIVVASPPPSNNNFDAAAFRTPSPGIRVVEDEPIPQYVLDLNCGERNPEDIFAFKTGQFVYWADGGDENKKGVGEAIEALVIRRPVADMADITGTNPSGVKMRASLLPGGVGIEFERPSLASFLSDEEQMKHFNNLKGKGISGRNLTSMNVQVDMTHVPKANTIAKHNNRKSKIVHMMFPDEMRGMPGFWNDSGHGNKLKSFYSVTQQKIKGQVFTNILLTFVIPIEPEERRILSTVAEVAEEDEDIAALFAGMCSVDGDMHDL